MGFGSWWDAIVTLGGLLLVIAMGVVPMIVRGERRRRVRPRQTPEGLGDAMGVVDEVFNPGARHARIERDIKRELQVPVNDARNLDDIEQGRIVLDVPRPERGDV